MSSSKTLLLDQKSIALINQMTTAIGRDAGVAMQAGLEGFGSGLNKTDADFRKSGDDTRIIGLKNNAPGACTEIRSGMEKASTEIRSGLDNIANSMNNFTEKVDSHYQDAKPFVRMIMIALIVFLVSSSIAMLGGPINLFLQLSGCGMMFLVAVATMKLLRQWHTADKVLLAVTFLVEDAIGSRS